MRQGKFLLYFFKLPFPGLKEVATAALEKLRIPSYDLTSTSLQIQGMSLLGYLFKAESEKEGAIFERAVVGVLQRSL